MDCIATTEAEIDAACRAGRISYEATSMGQWKRASGGSTLGGGFLRDRAGRLWVTPGMVKAEHLPAGADPLQLANDYPATVLAGFWRSSAGHLEPDGTTYEIGGHTFQNKIVVPWTEAELRASDPDWYDGPAVPAAALDALARPAWAQGYCGFSTSRLTGATNGTRTNYYLGATEIYGIPAGFGHYLALGMRPRMEGWLAFLAEVAAGTLQDVQIPDGLDTYKGAIPALFAAVGISQDVWCARRCAAIWKALGVAPQEPV